MLDLKYEIIQQKKVEREHILIFIFKRKFEKFRCKFMQRSFLDNTFKIIPDEH